MEKKLLKKQKLIGAIMVVLGLVSIIPTHDITAAVWCVPLGCYLAVTSEIWIEHEKFEKEDEED